MVVRDDKVTIDVSLDEKKLIKWQNKYPVVQITRLYSQGNCVYSVQLLQEKKNI